MLQTWFLLRQKETPQNNGNNEKHKYTYVTSLAASRRKMSQIATRDSFNINNNNTHNALRLAAV